MSRANRRRRYRARSVVLLATLRAGGYPRLRRRDLEQLVGSLRPWGHVRSSQPENLSAIF